MLRRHPAGVGLSPEEADHGIEPLLATRAWSTMSSPAVAEMSVGSP